MKHIKGTIKKALVLLLIAALMIPMLAGCGSTQTAASAQQDEKAAQSAEPIVLTYGHTDTEDSVTGRQAQLFADYVVEYTEGRVKIDVYPLGQMGTSAELVSAVKLGTVDITFLTMAMIGSMCDEFSALDTPYLFDDIAECVKVCDPGSAAMQYLTDKLGSEAGIKYLYSFYFGTRETTSNSPIYTPGDMKGKAFRSLAFEFYVSYIDSLGAVATQIDITELAQALQAGTVEGQENPVDVIISRQMYEYQKYLVLTNHMICCQGVVMNGASWDKIPEADRELIMKAAEQTVLESNEYAMNKTAEQTQFLADQGMTIIDESNGLDIQAFKDTVGTYIDEKYGEKYATIYDLIEQSKAA